MTEGKRVLEATPTLGSIGQTFTTHGENLGLRDLLDISRHARLSPSDARDQLIALVRAIPDDALEGYVAGQVVVVA